MQPDLDRHYTLVVKALLDGRLIPFLGAGVNLCGRPEKVAWQHGQYLPKGDELAAYLSQEFEYAADDATDLLRVSQYIAVMAGSGPLYEKLHGLFDADYPPTPLHGFFATLPKILREKGYASPYQLLVTTNYDDMLERAFEAAGEPYDVLTYAADGQYRGKFSHRLPNGETRFIEDLNNYRVVPIEIPSRMVKRPVILKIHGTINRAYPDEDSYVITEDHYIDYLTHTEIERILPPSAVVKLKNSSFLFLGYSLRDWNLRVILHRIWGERKLSFKSWAIQLKPQTLDQEFWRKRDVDILDFSLEDYLATLRERIERLPHASASSLIT